VLIRPLAAALAALLLVAAAPRSANPPSGLLPVKADAYTATVQRFLADQEQGHWSDAFGLLNGEAKRYYRSAANFASIYAADRFALRTYKLLGMRVDRLGRVYFVRESADYLDHAHDVMLNISVNVPLGVEREPGGLRIKDPGHPQKAVTPAASVSSDGVRVEIKKVSYYPRRLEVVLTIANAGTNFITALPYGKSILRDDAGHVYRLIDTRDWALTDKQLFEGVRLPENGQYTGFLAFETPQLDDARRRFTLTLAPLLRDGADAPVSIDIPFAGSERSNDRNP
jgi:hypothetical protein